MQPAPTLVIAHPDADIRRALKVLAVTEGHEVVDEAADGVAAVTAVGTARPSAVLLAEVLPRLGGREAAGVIAKLSPGTRVVALTPGPATPGWAVAALPVTRLENLGRVLAALQRSVALDGQIERARILATNARGTLATTLQRWERLEPDGARALLAHALAQLDETDETLATLLGRSRAGIEDPSSREDGRGRVRFADAATSGGRSSFSATVSLTKDDEVLAGDAHADAEPAAVVAATLEAVAPLLQQPTRPVSAERIDVGEDAIVVVTLEADGNLLSGSAPVREEPAHATARATLDALNRRLEKGPPPS